MLATVVGLCLALGGAPLIAVVRQQLIDRSLLGRVQCQLLLVGLGTAVILVTSRWERRPLASIGLRAPRWRSLLLGAALAAFFVFILSPAAMWLLARTNLAGFDSGLAKLAELPLWYRVLAVAVGGTLEELLYRGYAVERLSSLTGSYWLGGSTSVLAFAVAHVPMWGVGPALTTVASGAVLTLFYVWQRDLFANVIAHVITDGVGIVLMPLLTRAG